MELEGIKLNDLRFSNISGKWKPYIMVGDVMREIMKSEYDTPILAWSCEHFGGSAPLRYLLNFTFGHVIELKIEGDESTYDSYQGIFCNQRRMYLDGATGKQDSAYGTCVVEYWITQRARTDKDVATTVGDVVSIVLERYKIKQPADVKGAFYGCNNRLAVFEDPELRTRNCFKIIPWLYTYLTSQVETPQIQTPSENCCPNQQQ